MICRECREKVMFGWRNGTPGWLHREEKDHPGDPIVEPENSEEPEVIPEPELRSTPIDPASLAPRSGIKQIVNLVNKTDGWEMIELAESRGPWIGASGKVSGIFGMLRLKARGPGVDGEMRYAVASWRRSDTKTDFRWAWLLRRSKDSRVIEVLGRANSDNMKTWIKGGDADLLIAEEAE